VAATIITTMTVMTTLTPDVIQPEAQGLPAASAPACLRHENSGGISTNRGVQHDLRTPDEKPQAATALPSPALLRLMAWLSPAFPTGAFAYSHGLEWAVESRDISNETMLLAWLTDVIAHGTGRNDTILLRHAHRAATDPSGLRDIADLAYASASCRERQSESLNQGRAFMLAATPWGIPAVPERIPYPVAVGAVSGAHAIPEDATAAAYLQAIAANLISAAVRLVPLGQTAGLRVLAALEPTILAIAAETGDATLDDLGGCVFRSDLAAMRHETQYARLFRS
jgi:urease accessory protein